jgi:hypothetical protein
MVVLGLSSCVNQTLCSSSSSLWALALAPCLPPAAAAFFAVNANGAEFSAKLGPLEFSNASALAASRAGHSTSLTARRGDYLSKDFPEGSWICLTPLAPFRIASTVWAGAVPKLLILIGKEQRRVEEWPFASPKPPTASCMSDFA